MFNGNPHAPSTAWLNAIAGPGGYEDAKDGASGTETFDRDGDTYVVRVLKNPSSDDDPITRLPLLPWCGDCWEQIGDDDAEPPDTCPECDGDDTFLL